MSGKSEALIQDQLRLAAPRLGALLWRNNTGVAWDKTGRPIRYGLANDSAQVNAHTKSSDLIGLYPLVIRPEHVGHVIGQFVAIECKAEKWKWRGTDREVAQNHFLQIVLQRGGIGKFVNGELTLEEVLR